MPEQENPLNFSIQETMEMPTSSQELLNGLYGADIVTGDAEDVREIEKELPKKKVEKTVEKPAPEKPNAKEKPLTSFLSEEEEKEEVVVDEKEKEGQEEIVEENRFKALSKDLFNLGVFSKEEEENEDDISTPEDLLERFQYEKKKGAMEVVDRFIGKFGEDYQNAFQAIFVKGVNPKDYFGAYNTIKDFASLDLTSEINQAAVVRQALADQELEPEDITAELDRLKNNGDLDSVAQRWHKSLVKKEQTKIAQLEQESTARIEHQNATKNQYIKNVNTVLQDKVNKKEFDGIPINPKLAEDLQDYLLTDKYKMPSGETLTEFDRYILDLKRPENHEKKVKLALLLKIMEKDPTLSTIQRTGLSKKSDTLFSEVARQAVKTPVKQEKTTKPASWFGN